MKRFQIADCRLQIAECTPTANGGAKPWPLPIFYNLQSSICNGKAVRLPLLLALLILVALVAPGCQAFAWVLTKTVGVFVPEDEFVAECSLEGRSVLVLVDMKDPAMAADFPRLEGALADAVGRILTDKHACGPVVPSRSLETVRRTEPHFAQWPINQVGKHFNVDAVLHVEVFDYRLRDSASSNVYHGYAEVAVRIVSPETGEQVWPVLAAARLISAETTPAVEAETTDQQESILTDGLADKIARHFFTYKRDELPLRPKVK